MSATTEAILTHLQSVFDERARRQADTSWGARVAALKDFQQRRLARTYADLLASTRYGPAACFFLDELYGPGDFTSRDTQFSRVVPGLVIFPHDVVRTVSSLAELHALTEALDSAMARAMSGDTWTPAVYARAWQATGRADDRERQIVLTAQVATRLDELVRKPLLRQSLRLMRAPARAAGVAALQQFLETGFDTFKAMRGAGDFIRTIEDRERALAAALFAADLVALDQGAGTAAPIADLAGADPVSPRR